MAWAIPEKPTTAQIRNVLRRAEGMEQQETCLQADLREQQSQR
jgi:hypothetical protein